MAGQADPINPGGYVVRGGWRAVQPTPSCSGLDRPNPFSIALVAAEDEVDVYGHVNNTVYARWVEACAWAHSAAVGLPPETCRALNRGMALRSLELEFERAAAAGQPVIVSNWVTEVGRLKAVRHFQVHTPEGETLARAVGRYVCINLETGAPTRMPPEFVAGYVLT
jgi:acyl-CoA thioester hydrolase